MKTALVTILIFASLTSCNILTGDSDGSKDSTKVVIDSTKAPVDSVKVDSTIVKTDTVK